MKRTINPHDAGKTSRRQFAKSVATTLATLPLAEAYLEVASARFGDKLSSEQLDQVRKDLEGNVRTAERLRAVKLKNGDEPDFTFKA